MGHFSLVSFMYFNSAQTEKSVSRPLLFALNTSSNRDDDSVFIYFFKLLTESAKQPFAQILPG